MFTYFLSMLYTILVYFFITTVYTNLVYFISFIWFLYLYTKYKSGYFFNLASLSLYCIPILFVLI